MQDASKEELLAATREGNVDRLLDLLEDIRERNCRDESTLQAAFAQAFAIKDTNDETLLHIAAGKGYNHILDALIRHGFLIDVLSSGATALHRAVEGEHISCVKCLVSYGALIMQDSEGHTPIDISRQRGFQAICTLFDTHPRTRKTSGISDELNAVAQRVGKRRLVVGISGATCSGKSTLTRALVKHFACKEPFHHLDTYWKDFHHFPREQGFVIGERPECLRMDLFAEVLKRRQFGEDDILFVDGFLLYHSHEIRELLDVKIFLQISEAECRQRRKTRNPGTSKSYYEKVIWPSYLKYNENYTTHPPGLMDSSTLILDGERPTQDVLNDAILFINKHLIK